MPEQIQLTFPVPPSPTSTSLKVGTAGAPSAMLAVEIVTVG